MNSLEAVPKPIERSWKNGPWIQVHKPKWDTSVNYVCDCCLLPAYTGVRVAKSGLNRGKWCCASCEAEKKRLAPRTRTRTQMAGILRKRYKAASGSGS